MAKIFFPDKDKIARIPASEPHTNAEYVISIGTEMWEDGAHKVIKVQMAYNGKISGRKSPSYPIESDDYERVNDEIKKLLGK